MTPDSPKGPENEESAPSKELVAYLRRLIGQRFDELLATANFLDEDDQASTLAVFEDVLPVVAQEIANRAAAYDLMLTEVRSQRDEWKQAAEAEADLLDQEQAERRAEVSRLREQLAAQRPAQHKVRVTKLLGSGQSVAVCPGCKEGMTGPDQQAQDWKDQHEADTLRPTLDPMEHDTDAAAAHFIKNAMIAEGRPSGSERLAPQSVDELVVRLRGLVFDLQDKPAASSISYDNGWRDGQIQAGNDLEALLDEFDRRAAEAARSEAIPEEFPRRVWLPRSPAPGPSDSVQMVVADNDVKFKRTHWGDWEALPPEGDGSSYSWARINEFMTLTEVPSPSLRKEGEDSD